MIWLTATYQSDEHVMYMRSGNFNYGSYSRLLFTGGSLWETFPLAFYSEPPTHREVIPWR